MTGFTGCLQQPPETCAYLDTLKALKEKGRGNAPVILPRFQRGDRYDGPLYQGVAPACFLLRLQRTLRPPRVAPHSCGYP